MTLVVVRPEPDATANMERASVPLLHRVTGDVEADAQRGCPVDTGLLVSTIESVKLADRGQVRCGSREAYYWLFVEYGTRYMLAEPFMRPALYQARHYT